MNIVYYKNAINKNKLKIDQLYFTEGTWYDNLYNYWWYMLSIRKECTQSHAKGGIRGVIVPPR